MSALHIDRLIQCLKQMQRESKALADRSAKSGDLYAGYSDKRRARFAEEARDSAVQLRRLKFEAHALAVEVGIADLRSDDQYGPTMAAAGFGRVIEIHRRRPNLVGECSTGEQA